MSFTPDPPTSGTSFPSSGTVWLGFTFFRTDLNAQFIRVAASGGSWATLAPGITEAVKVQTVS